MLDDVTYELFCQLLSSLLAQKLPRSSMDKAAITAWLLSTWQVLSADVYFPQHFPG